MFKRVVEHMKDVDRVLQQLNSQAAFAFALACTERQWPVFQRASVGRTSLNPGQSNLRRGIDAAWEQTINGIPVPSQYLEDCLSEVPEEVSDGPAAAAHTIANSIVDLLQAVREQEAAYGHCLSGRNLGLLELLLDEQGTLLDDLQERAEDEPDHLRPVHVLVEREISQQNRDLQLLVKDCTGAVIEVLRRDSTGKSLFGEIWF